MLDGKIYRNMFKSIMQNKFGLMSQPHFITFLITWRCNCKCAFCNIWKKEAAVEKELSIEQIENIFKQFTELDVLRITGGEPFLRKDLAEVINILDDCTNPSIIHLTTNGLLTKKIINVMESIKSTKKLHIKISIDEVGEKHDRIRGTRGAYECAIKSVEELIKFKKFSPGFTLGINFAITGPQSMAAYKYLRDKFKGDGVALYPVIAHKNDNALYSAKNSGVSSVRFEPFGTFTPVELRECLDTILEDSRKDASFSEKLVSRYFLKGLENRLMHQKNYPAPGCVALGNHLRILPDGSVPVCFFNSEIIGNLVENSWEELKSSDKVKKAKKWINACQGCWESCEVIPGAVYTGDLAKALFW